MLSATLPADRIQTLLEPYLHHAPPEAVPARLFDQLETYLALLIRWNAQTNLTAIRDPEAIVQRHFGESLFTGFALHPRLALGATLLDVGSGAGFPGLPIQLLRPDLQVTLAESQGKKAVFLREVARTLRLPTGIFSARVETMPPDRHFDAVTLRAVDCMGQATELARDRVAANGWLAILGTKTRLSEGESLQMPVPLRDTAVLVLERC